MKIQIGSFTEKGLRRKQEDAEYAVQSLERTPFCWLAVADGMGGHAHGDDASRTAIESLDNIPTSENGMRRFFDRADYRVTSIGTDLPNSRKRSGPGTTLTAAFIQSGKMLLGHIGDSRCYLLRGDVMKQLTQDHNVAAVIKANDPSAEPDARWYATLTRGLGNWSISDSSDWQKDAKGNPSPYDVISLSPMPGDALLLCTDGVHGVNVPLQMMLSSGRYRTDGEPAEITAKKIVEAALRAGSRDNCTAVVAYIEEI